MSLGRLLGQNLLFHWRGNLAVLLGVAVGTAVLVGALLVGDSLHGSLRELTLQRLGWVDQALVAGRFFRAELADRLPAERIAPALLLQGSLSTAAGPPRRRAGHVTVLGVDGRFWPPGEAPLDPLLRQPGPHDVPQDSNAVFLNESLARELGVKQGEEVILHVQKVSAVPRESLLGKREGSDVVNTIELRVRGVLPDASPGGRFSLIPSPEPPRNAFVPLHYLQSRLDQKGRVNALLVGGAIRDLQPDLARHLTLDDWNLVLREPAGRVRELFTKLDRNGDGELEPREWRDQLAAALVRAADRNGNEKLSRAELDAFYREHRGYLSLESRQMLLEPAVEKAALAAAGERGLLTAPTLVYLANWIDDGKAKIPYSVVAALDPARPSPLGPFLPPGVDRLADDEIVLADWKESPLQAKVGEPITLTYFLPEKQGGLKETSHQFRLAGRVPLHGAAADPDLTPEFPGITDKLDIRQWDPPFPYDNKRIKPADDRYWKEYRTAPKAYVRLAKGQQLWHSRFGNLTSLRLAPANKGREPADLTQTAEQFRQSLLQHLKPEEGGFVFDAVKQRGLHASGGGTNFGEYYLSFSFFLIVAALLLVGLLFRLSLDRRAAEIGLLLATGYRRSTVRWLLLAEGAVLAGAGALIGCAAAGLYTRLLLSWLRESWPGGLDRAVLQFHAEWTTFLIGYTAAVAVSLVTVGWAVWVLGRVPPRTLLAGETTAEGDPTRPQRPSRWGLGLCIGATVAALGLVVAGTQVRNAEAKALTFFGSGALLLTAGLAGVWTWMHGSRQGQVAGHGSVALARLGVRNAGRHAVRSLLTAGLLAAAAFLLVAGESFRRRAESNYLDRDSGSGGFALLGEADVPVFQNLNEEDGRKEMSNGLERQLRPSKEDLQARMKVLAGAEFFPFRIRAGDDASCLNLYQPRRPRLLGVPDSLVQRGGFRFTAIEAKTDEERKNPWLLLQRPRDDDTVPVFGEEHTVSYMLHSKPGGVLEVLDERGELRKLRIVGLLKDSVFQSGLLLSDAAFLRLYPSQQGYNLFLIDTREQRPEEVKELLETALTDRGFTVTPTAQKLESYLAVENTYLSTFQALGGLGLMLGALGLAVVLLRGVWERRGELALLRALGYRHTALGWLVLAENGFLLVLGLGAGTLAALVAVAPHMAARSGEMPWPRLAGMLGLVLVVGLVAGAAAVAATLRAPLLPALRRE
jgi:ABC-type antimicrobial peptide transport system permease subunit